MNFQQLRIIREAVKRDFNLTEVADTLLTSQSGVSRHIKDLEEELGVELFVRRGKRLTGLTEPGKELLPIVERLLLDAQNVKRLGEQFSGQDRGRLSIATTHTQARYALPDIVSRFRAAFPLVQLVLHQAGPAEIAAMLLDGTAEIAVATEALGASADFATFPFHSWRHTVVVPAGHPLEGREPLTVEDLAEFPVVTYHEGFTGRARVDEAFARAGRIPNVVVSALDADVIKAYVELGLGVGILASIAVSRTRDPGLRELPSAHLFEPSTSLVAVRRGSFLRRYTSRFIELCAPSLSEAQIRGRAQAAAGV